MELKDEIDSLRKKNTDLMHLQSQFSARNTFLNKENDKLDATISDLRVKLLKFEKATGILAKDISSAGKSLHVGASKQSQEQIDTISADNHELLLANNELQSQLIDQVGGRADI